MSRKTRKLIWSAPLVAVLAVAGALAMFRGALAPRGGRLHEAAMHGAPGPVTGPDRGASRRRPCHRSSTEGRTQITLTWMAPAVDTGTSGDQLPHRLFRATLSGGWRNLEASVS